MFEKKSLNTLEYPKILDQLASFCQSEGGKLLSASITPCDNIIDAERMLDETAEADLVLFKYSTSPSFGIDDIEQLVELSKKGAMLAISDFLKVARVLRVSKNVVKLVESVPETVLLREYSSRLFFSNEIEKAISDAFVSENEVSDNASLELKHIRQNIRKLNANLKEKLHSYTTKSDVNKYLQDNIVTMRNGRYVIPLKSEHKGKIQGLIHDQSASGSTLFVEPLRVVELNNDLRVEKLNEQAEIEKIMRAFSVRISGIADALIETNSIISRMDVIFAKAQLSAKQKATKPTLNASGIIDIEKGRHPLLRAKKIVPVSIKMGESDKMLLITGPNTGGKTVTLKLAGLFTLMALSGMFLPARSANIGMFDGVYCDIGDEQSIEQNLSTFSSHIKNINDILGKITAKSLILFDELGAGTDPSEGAALAVAIAEHINCIGSKSIVTSHFNELKEFALTVPNIVSASMQFDMSTLSPTYKLILGMVGSSNAISIAEKLGLNSDIVLSAKQKMSKEKIEFNNVLSAAEETRRKAEQLQNSAEITNMRAQNTLTEAERERQVVKEKQEKLNNAIRRETKLLIEDSYEEASDIIQQMREKLDKQNLTEQDIFDARRMRKQLDAMAPKYEENITKTPERQDGQILAGDRVYIVSLQKQAKIIKINNKGDADVQIGNLKAKIKKGDFYKIK